MNNNTSISGPENTEPENNSTLPIVESHEIRQAELSFIADARERRIARVADSVMTFISK